jgi:hypothetical protein
MADPVESAVITYDVSGKQAEVKKRMKALGYLDAWKSGEIVYYLPNTTLWKKGKTKTDAISDLLGIAQALSVKVERAMAFNSDPWYGIKGEPHKE